jgi:hypothetical protein
MVLTYGSSVLPVHLLSHRWPAIYTRFLPYCIYDSNHPMRYLLCNIKRYIFVIGQRVLPEASSGTGNCSRSQLTSPKMQYLEDIPTPDNGFYVLVTGANRYVYATSTIPNIDLFAAASGWVSERA